MPKKPLDKAWPSPPPLENDGLRRNSYGLPDNISYEIDDLGFINYRKLIPQEFLVPNRQIFQKKDMIVPKTVEGLDDNQILVLLAGWRWLARVRGFKSVTHEILSASNDAVLGKTTVCWRGNFETNYEDICFSALATASINNTTGFGQYYLAEMAENRGFSRAVRGFLNISLVGADEIADIKEKQPVQEFKMTEPHGVLQKKLSERGKSFEKFKSEWLKLGHDEAGDWDVIEDIPIKDVWTILEMIKKKESK